MTTKNKTAGGPGGCRAYQEVRVLLGLTKAGVYRFLGWESPAIKLSGTPWNVVKNRANWFRPHPFGDFIRDNLNRGKQRKIP